MAGPTKPDSDPIPAASDGRRPRIAYLSFSSGEYDSRSLRMARSAVDAGYEVTVYARWHPGLPPIEQHDGYRLVRAPHGWRLIVPGLRGPARRRFARQMAEAARHSATGKRPADRGATPTPEAAGDPAKAAPVRRRSLPKRIVRYPVRRARRAAKAFRRAARRWRRAAWLFPLRPMAWAAALDTIAEPADIWHGMWAGSLPALERLRRRHGGRTIYDSRDVYMLSREFSRLGQPLKSILARIERRWARSADRVLTVNESYADLLARQLGIARPLVVMNCPEAWTPPAPPPDLIREATGVQASTSIALYQGKLMSDRGIEQAMDAILDVPDAVLVLLGFGDWERKLTALVASTPYRGRVFVLPAVPPADLVAWSASADVLVVAIQPSSVNHQFTTPQKLFEAITAGVPVVASDLPGMAAVVNATGVGTLCDPTSPASIAAGIRRLLEPSPAERAALRAHVLRVGHEQYNWGAQLDTLFGLYRELARAIPPTTSPRIASVPRRPA